MGKGLVSVLMIPLLLVGGCAAQKTDLEESFSAFRQAVTVTEHISASVALTADYGDTAEEYTLALSYDGRQTEVEIIAPELLAGVKATAARGETSVSYDGVMLGAGALSEEGITPATALPVILDAMASGYVELLWSEGGYVTARLYVGESDACTLWLEADTLTPAAAELVENGKTIVTCRFSDWEMT